MLPFKVVSIHGAPRSGTSWLGQIFNSHPEVAYRFQPLFSYRFKAAINSESSREEVEAFLANLYSIKDDEFILQTQQKDRGVHPVGFAKSAPSTLVMKEVRYHYVIEALRRSVPDIRLIGIVRHPCGAINSWLKTPREFKPEWDMFTEWRSAPKKSLGRREEYYGFAKWRELASLFLDLSIHCPDSFRLVRYEDLVRNPVVVTQKLFAFCGLDLAPQTITFLSASQASELDDPDTVYRRPDVASRWEDELHPAIRDTILHEVRSTNLEIFL